MQLISLGSDSGAHKLGSKPCHPLDVHSILSQSLKKFIISGWMSQESQKMKIP